MKNKKLILYGVGHFAECVAYMFTQDSQYEVEAFCVESKYHTEEQVLYEKIPLVSFDNIEETYPPEEYEMFITTGHNGIRERIFNEAKHKGYKLASYVCSKSLHWNNLKIGENVFIDMATAIQCFTEIEDNTFLIAAHIGHHTHIGKNSLISEAVLGADVVIGNNCFLGINSCVKSHVKIGNNNIIGMGSIIAKDTGDNEIYTTKYAVKRDIPIEKVISTYLRA